MSCPACEPDLAPASTRRHEAHFVVSLGDAGRTVYRNGVQIHNCYEVDAAAGIAKCYRVPPEPCDCGEGIAAYLAYGEFTVQ